MPGVDNYSRVVLRAFHATPSTVVLRPMPSPHSSTHIVPTPAQVASGVTYGPAQPDQVEYRTGTASVGGGGNTYSRSRVVNP